MKCGQEMYRLYNGTVRKVTITNVRMQYGEVVYTTSDFQEYTEKTAQGLLFASHVEALRAAAQVHIDASRKSIELAQNLWQQALELPSVPAEPLQLAKAA